MKPPVLLPALLFLILAAYFPGGPRAEAQVTPPPLWQIGTQNHDDQEFALAPDKYSHYEADGLYLVGRSQAKTDWPYVQPGPADAWAGSRPHTSRIFFSLTHAESAGGCTLTLAFVDTQSASPPRLEIQVNGQTWTRQTVAGGGDASIFGQPDKGKPSLVTINFPAGLLHVGTNEVQITTISGSWLLYDAVTLDTPTGDTLGAAPSVLLISDALWLHDVLTGSTGHFQQVLHMQIVNSGPPAAAILHVSGEPDRTLQVPSGSTTREESYPEVRRAVKTQVQITAEGRPADEAALTVSRTPCRRYTIYCLEQSHMDIGYAYFAADALARHQQYLETSLAQIAQTANLPSDDQFRWNVESLYAVDSWLKKATPAQRAVFVADVRNGHLGLSALYCNELTGLCRPEELAALLNCANEIRTTYHVPIDSAMITDVPGYTWGLIPLLAQAGVKYFSWGPNPGDHMGNARDQDNKAFYWLSPSGKARVLVWQSPNGYQPLFDDNENSLVNCLQSFDTRFPNNPYDMFYDRRTTGDNAPPDLALPPFVQSWNSHYAYPHLVLATTSQMFHVFAARYGKTLPTVRGDYTGYWEDGAASSAAETAINRHASELIAQDEILWSLLHPHTYPASAVDTAWTNAVLYDEHTWGAWDSWDAVGSDFVNRQWAEKRQFAVDAIAQARALRVQAFANVAAPHPTRTIAVFNTLNWPRTDLITLPLAISKDDNSVRDEAGHPVPTQRLADGDLAFLAENIPALSSRKFTLSSGPGDLAGSASPSQTTLHMGRMALHVDPHTGAIVSWRVAGVAGNLVNLRDKTCRGLNDYLYVLGDDNKKVQYAGPVKLSVVDKGPLVASIRVDSGAPGVNSLSRLVEVVDGLNEVRVTDTLDKQAIHENEAIHFGFPFDVPGATDRLDMPWSVVRPNLDQTAYANKSVFPIQRWADVSNARYGVTCADLDTPILQIGEITQPRENQGGWLTKALTGGTLIWNAMNNYWHTNYRAEQPGPATFRYVLRAHGPFDQTAAQHFGIEQSQPLLWTTVKASQPDVHLPLTFSNSAILLTACHPLPDGRHWLIRLFNGSQHTQSVHVSWVGSLHLRLARTDLWANGPGTPTANTLTLAPMEVITLRVTP